MVLFIQIVFNLNVKKEIPITSLLVIIRAHCVIHRKTQTYFDKKSFLTPHLFDIGLSTSLYAVQQQKNDRLPPRGITEKRNEQD